MELKLVFDRTDKVYSAGDIIKCTLHMIIHKEVKCRSISMRILGIGSTEFELKSAARQKCRKVVSAAAYTGYEEYFRHYKYFFGSKGALETIITPGKYEYSESYELPPNLPANFDGDYGHIKYLVRVKVENNWTTDQMVVESFNLKPVMTLRELQPTCTVIEQRNQKFFHSWWLGKKYAKPVEITATLTSAAFVTGSTVNVAINVLNKSNIKIKNFHIKLEQCITFKGSFNVIDSIETGYSEKSIKTTSANADTDEDGLQTSEITSTRVLWDRIFPVAVKQRQTRDFIAEVPIPTEQHVKLLPGSRLMQCDYYIRLTASVNRFHSDPELIIRFKIATGEPQDVVK